MNKCICLLVFAILTRGSVSAQEVDTAIAIVRYSYSYVMDTTQPDNPYKDDMALLIGKKLSNYTSYNAMLRMKKAMDNASKGIGEKWATEGGPAMGGRGDRAGTMAGASLTAKLFVTGSYYKYQPTSTMAYMAFAVNELFSVEEKIPAIDWKIGNETKEIHGLPCQKATGDYRGRNYEAWFCSQLAYNNGPWKLGGLPGLILEAYDTKKEVVFTFESFESNNEKIPIAIPTFAIKTTPGKYKQYEQALQNNSAGVLPPGIIRSDTFHNGDGKTVKNRARNNPVEKEQN
ncbi:MAG: GLPGLI family protein [Bacteroidota bacterium]